MATIFWSCSTGIPALVARADRLFTKYYDNRDDGGLPLRWSDEPVVVTDFTPGTDQIEIQVFGRPADNTPELVAVTGGTMIRFGEDDVMFLPAIAPGGILNTDIIINLNRP